MTSLDRLDSGLLAKIMMYRAMGWTQTEIADELGISQSKVSRYGAAIREASLAEKRNILRFFLPLLLGGLAAGFGFTFWRIFSKFRP